MALLLCSILFVFVTKASSENSLSATCYDSHLHIVLHSDEPITSLDRIQWAYNEESNWIQHKSMVTCTSSECSLSPDGHTLYIKQFLYHSFAEYSKYKYAINFIGKYTIPTNWQSQPKEVTCPTFTTTTSAIISHAASTNLFVTTERVTTKLRPRTLMPQMTTVDPDRIYMVATCRNRQLEIKLHLGRAKTATLDMLQFAVDGYNTWAHPPPMLNCVREDCKRTGDIVTMKKTVNNDDIKFAVNVMTHTVLPPCELWFDYPYYMRCDGSTVNGLEVDHLNKCPQYTQTVYTTTTVPTTSNIITTETTTLQTTETTVPTTAQQTTTSTIPNRTSISSSTFTPLVNATAKYSTTSNTQNYTINGALVNKSSPTPTEQTQHQGNVWMEAVCNKSGNLTVTLHLGSVKPPSIEQIKYAIEDFYSWSNPPVLHTCGQSGTDCIVTGDRVTIHKQLVQSSFNKFTVHVGNDTIFPPCDNWIAYPYTINCDGNRITDYSSVCGSSHLNLTTTPTQSVSTTANTLTLNYHNPYKIWMEATCNNDRNLTVKIHLGTANVSRLEEVVYALDGFYDWSNPPSNHTCHQGGGDCTCIGDTVTIQKQMKSSFNKLAVFIKNYTVLPPCDNWIMFPYTVICNGHSVDSRTLGPPEEMYQCQNKSSPSKFGFTTPVPGTSEQTSASVYGNQTSFKYTGTTVIPSGNGNSSSSTSAFSNNSSRNVSTTKTIHPFSSPSVSYNLTQNTQYVTQSSGNWSSSSLISTSVPSATNMFGNSTTLSIHTNTNQSTTMVNSSHAFTYSTLSNNITTTSNHSIGQSIGSLLSTTPVQNFKNSSGIANFTGSVMTTAAAVLNITKSSTTVFTMSSSSKTVFIGRNNTHVLGTQLTTPGPLFTQPSKSDSVNTTTISSTSQVSQTRNTYNIPVNISSTLMTTTVASNNNTSLYTPLVTNKHETTVSQVSQGNMISNMFNNNTTGTLSTINPTYISNRTDTNSKFVTHSTVSAAKFTSSPMLPNVSASMPVVSTTASTIGKMSKTTTHVPQTVSTILQNVISTNNANTGGITMETTTVACPPFPKDCPKGCATFGTNWCWTCDRSLCSVNSTSNVGTQTQTKPYSTQSTGVSSMVNSFTTSIASSPTTTSTPKSTSRVTTLKTTTTPACPHFPEDCPKGCATFGNNWCWICDLSLCVTSTSTSYTNSPDPVTTEKACPSYPLNCPPGCSTFTEDGCAICQLSLCTTPSTVNVVTSKQTANLSSNSSPGVTSVITDKHTITKPITQDPSSTTGIVGRITKHQPATTTTQGCLPVPSSCPVYCRSYDDNFCQVCDYSLSLCDVTPPPSTTPLTKTSEHQCDKILCVLNCGNPPKYKKDEFGCNICACDYTG